MSTNDFSFGLLVCFFNSIGYKRRQQLPQEESGDH